MGELLLEFLTMPVPLVQVCTMVRDWGAALPSGQALVLLLSDHLVVSQWVGGHR